jgi:hypothetical protein
LHQGDTASAVIDVRALLALARASRDEHYAISELVRMAIAHIAIAVNWEILQSPNLTDKQLSELQSDWRNLDFIQGEINALQTERAEELLTIAKWRHSNSELQSYFATWYELHGEEAGLFQRTRFGIEIFRWRYWWSFPDEMRAIKGSQILLETARSAKTNYSLLAAMRAQESRIQKLEIDRKSADSLWFSDLNKIDLHSLLSASVISLSGIFNKVMSAETAKQVAISAIALKRYQLKHGYYPPDLDSLVPGFVPAVPLDPVDGQPLRYRHNADSTFLLYSVGENGQDDGGDPSLEKVVQSSNFYWQNPHALDWVWPQPATPEEVRNFYEHPPK